MRNSRFITVLTIIVLAALSRILPHPPNVTPLTAIALFGGAYFTDKRIACIVPLLIMFLSDWIIGFHSQIVTVYLCFLLTVALGIATRSSKKKVIAISGATLLGSVIFFIATNFGVWLWDGLYPRTLTGLWTCYVAAIPFFRNAVLGDFFYVAILFGSIAFAQYRFPVLRGKRASIL